MTTTTPTPPATTTTAPPPALPTTVPATPPALPTTMPATPAPPTTTTSSTARAVRCFFAACVAVVVCVRCVPAACDLVVVPGQPPGATTLEHRLALRGLLRRVHDGEHVAMRRFFPEGGLFSLSFTGFSVVDVVVADADADDDDRAEARAEAQRELLWLIAQAKGERDVEPFSLWGPGAKANGGSRGVIYDGHLNLLRAGYVVVGGTDAAVLDEFHAESLRLARAFQASPAGLLASFPHEVWPVDNLVALESLRQHDALFHTRYAPPAVQRLSSWWARHTKDGAFVSETDVDGGKVRDGPRGCSLSWAFAFLPGLDPALDARFWPRYRRDFTVDVLGTTGFREYPTRVVGRVDADSGPVVFGVGAAASAFGVAAAGAHDDDAFYGRVVTALELLTLPSFNLRGEKQLFGGHLLLADALSLWGRTHVAWDAPPTPRDGDAPVVAVAFAVVVSLVPLWSLLRLRRRFCRALPPRPWIGVGVVVVVVALVADLALPLTLLALALVERLSLRAVGAAPSPPTAR